MQSNLMSTLAVVAVVTACGADVAAKDGVSAGIRFMRKYCIRCHGEDYKYPGLDLADRVTLVTPADSNEDPFLVPKDPDESRIWQRADGGGMPPDDQPLPTEKELAEFRRWIESGATFPLADRPRRVFVGERTLLSIILTDLRKQPSSRQQYVRYFSLVHLWNNPDVSDEHLRIVRAGLSKLINSLSSQPRVAPPQVVDDDGLVLRIDLRDYGWKNSQQWFTLLKAYPYGLRLNGPEAGELYELTYCDLPYLRADWFIYHAARPPLYHELVTLPDYVGIPKQQSDLEKLVGVNLWENYQEDRLWRAAFSGKKSGVSDHNRMVERHDSKYGWYWPSYDSAGDSDRQNFFRYPLGPRFPNSENFGAFEHDGGEIVFSLPNRLQAYMLALADGTRINEGPLSIVSDANRFSGSNAVVNGISCMGCHRNGLIPFTDTVRPQWESRVGDLAEKVLRLFPEKKIMDQHFRRDQTQFLNALEEAIGPFLRTGDDDGRKITEFVEPITAASKRYDRPVELTDVARELGLPEKQDDATAHRIKATAGELATAIKFSTTLRRLELDALTVGEPLTRKQWEKVFGSTARELGIGLPLLIR
jgi:serine/threonine-protein kinase